MVMLLEGRHLQFFVHKELDPSSYVSPLYTEVGHVGLPLSAQCFCRVLRVCVSHSFLFSALSISGRPSNTRRWPKAGLILAHHLRRWANNNPVLGNCVMFGATLNVGQRHRWRANINPALVQQPAAFECSPAKRGVEPVLVWCLASVADGGPALDQH